MKTISKALLVAVLVALIVIIPVSAKWSAVVVYDTPVFDSSGQIGGMVLQGSEVAVYGCVSQYCNISQGTFREGNYTAGWVLRDALEW